ncbi:MAG: O-methyltransferase [Armatimonadota bacterium]|jgi:predicted O-methyltransferase YrrM
MSETMTGSEFRADDWESYVMDTRDPFAALEPIEAEVEVVGEALEALTKAGVIPRGSYDHAAFAAHREAARESFEIPWTAISPRQERLIWALNAIRRPARIIAAGVFCGFTFICNAGAGAGPGAVYEPEDLVGVEIKADEAERARRNVEAFAPNGRARIVAADAVELVADYCGMIDLLYLDADGDRGRGKGIYLEILEAALPHLAPGALVLAHNSVNCAEKLADYLQFVRDPARMAVSVNVILDGEGLEVSRR